jgi:eukaryotic-like serine/threonine-protein kinase
MLDVPACGPGWMDTELRARLDQSLGDAYRLERELGGGGMSRVYVAEETALGRRLVIKVLPPETAGAVDMDRFRREVLLAASLQHPHVVPVLSAGSTDGLLYYTMPYVAGESLRDRLAREGALPVADAIRILREVADALAHAHGHGVVHRDVKPGNVLLAERHAVVADFGIAKALAAAGEHGPSRSVTGTGIVIGTPAYMAPEQAAADARVDHRADIYAFGALAYEVLTGQVPFAGPNAQAVLAAHLTRPPVPLRVLRPAVPDALEALVMRCLEKNAADRPQSAAEVLQALDALPILVSGGAQAHAPASLGSPRARRRWLPAPAVAAVALVVLAGGGALLAARLRPDGGDRATTPALGASVAVLPFENVGGDTAQLYFADGMTDELAMALAKVPGLQVAARTSSRAFRGRQPDVRIVGRQLGVAAVLTGTVRRAGPALRVTAQLADARTGLVRWSDAYTADNADVFAVQARLAGAIVQALAPALAGGDDPPAYVVAGAAVMEPARGTDDAVAYDLYLRARALWYQRGAARLLRAESLFTAATARDPRFARAFAGLALARAILPDYTFGASYETQLSSVREATGRALALDSTQAEAHTALAWVLGGAGRWSEAEEHFRRSIALAPRDPTTHMWYGSLLQTMAGRSSEGVAHLRTAAALDPLSGQIAGVYARVLAGAGEREEARTVAARALALDPARESVHRNVGIAWMQLGEYGRAAAEFEAARRLVPPTVPLYLGGLAAAYAFDGQRARAAAITAELERLGRLDSLAAGGELVEAFAGLGDTARALDVLEWLVARGEWAHYMVMDVANDPYPVWEQLRRAPRFARLREHVESERRR